MSDSAIPTTMRALFQPDMHSQGLILTERPVPKPRFALNEHLIRVHTVAPCAGELLWPANYPVPDPASKELIPCDDVTGTIISAPPSSPFKVGDEVYGRTNYHRSGCASDYAIGRTEELALKPQSLGWAEAATVPLSSLTAWQALFIQAGLGDFSTERFRGKRVLVTAAAGGVGTWAVQLARIAGAEVVGTCGPKNIDFVRSLGATDVVDYTTSSTKDWVETNARKFDVVFDCTGKKALEDAWWGVKDGGVLISICQPPEQWKPSGWKGKDVQNLFFIMKPDGPSLTRISELIAEGKCRAVLDSTWPLDRYEEAYKRLDSGHSRGKVVLEIIPEA